jgi:YihY family inner membrane protein
VTVSDPSRRARLTRVGLGVASTGREILAGARAVEVPFLAAALAYYALVSVVPLLLFVFVVASALAGGRVATSLLDAVGAFLSPAGRDLVAETVGDPRGRGGATVAGTGVLLWGALRLFRGFDAAFARVYGQAGRSLVAGVRAAVTVLVCTGLGFLLTVAGGVVVAGVGGVPARLFALPVVLVTLTLVFLPAFVVFPDADVGLREALPGAAVVAVGWTALQVGFATYAGVVGTSAAGALGGVVLLVSWFYLAAALVLVGAVVNAVLAGREL